MIKLQNKNYTQHKNHMNQCFVAVLKGWYVPNDMKIPTKLLLFVLLLFYSKTTTYYRKTLFRKNSK